MALELRGGSAAKGREYCVVGPLTKSIVGSFVVGLLEIGD
jgi:hypothetical protein